MITVDFKRLSIRKDDRILDVGCGSGRHIDAAIRFGGGMVVGADICFEDVRKARLRTVDTPAVAEFVVTDITELPFADNVFDILICSEVLEHIPDHRRAISEMMRILKPEGRLVISVPRFLPEKICWILSDSYHNVERGHIRIYTQRTLKTLFSEFGLVVEGVHYAHSLHSPYWWLKCLVGPHREDSILVNLYHRLLVWDMMKHPRLTRFLDRWLNPVIGKSIVFYLAKR